MFPFCFFFLTITDFGWAGNVLNCGEWQRKESQAMNSAGLWGGGYTQPCLHTPILHSGLWSFLLLLIKSYHVHLVSIRVWKCCLQDPPTIWNSLVGFFPPLISTNIQPPKLEMFREIVEFTHQELPCLTEAINVRMFMIRTQFYTQLNILSNRTTQSWTNWYQCPLQLNVLTF